MSINRKLIRSDLAAARQAATSSRKKPPPAETPAEAFYYVKQMAGRTPMVVVTMVRFMILMPLSRPPWRPILVCRWDES